METLLTVTRKIRKCKTCEHTCEEKPPIVGCESVYAPRPPFKMFNGKTYDTWCMKRIWFDKCYFAVNLWRWPRDEEFETVSEKEWKAILAKELKQIQMEAIKT